MKSQAWTPPPCSPAAVRHGELTAMLLFHAYHKSKGEKRSKILIPDTAHGTNPASASLCGYESVPVVKSNEDGILSVESVEGDHGRGHGRRDGDQSQHPGPFRGQYP